MIVEDKGYAFKTETGKWFLVRCPKCHKENWAMSVSSGVCARMSTLSVSSTTRPIIFESTV